MGAEKALLSAWRPPSGQRNPAQNYRTQGAVGRLKALTEARSDQRLKTDAVQPLDERAL